MTHLVPRPGLPLQTAAPVCGLARPPGAQRRARHRHGLQLQLRLDLLLLAGQTRAELLDVLLSHSLQQQLVRINSYAMRQPPNFLSTLPLPSHYHYILTKGNACLNSVLNVKAQVGTFHKEKALVGTFSVICNLCEGSFEALQWVSCSASCDLNTPESAALQTR